MGATVLTTFGKLHRVETVNEPGREPQELEPRDIAEAVGPESEPLSEAPADGARLDAEDRIFTVVVLGVMALLLLCIIVILIASRRPPAGL